MIAFDRDRPGRQDRRARLRGGRDAGGICPGCPQLQAYAFDLHRAAVPHQPSLFELGATLAGRPPGGH